MKRLMGLNISFLWMKNDILPPQKIRENKFTQHSDCKWKELTRTWQDERILVEINNTLPPELLKNGTRGKKDFWQHSGWGRRQNLIIWENLNERHDTPVEWISKEKILSWQNKKMGRREQHHHAPGTKVRMEWTKGKREHAYNKC